MTGNAVTGVRSIMEIHPIPIRAQQATATRRGQTCGLALFVFHRKYSSALEGEAAGDAERGEKGEVGHAPAVAKTKAAPTAPVWLEQAKEFMKTMCVHERIIVKNDASALCPSTSPVDSKGANATDKRVD